MKTQMRTKKPARAGFTLIELLVVMAVIGILSSIILGAVFYGRRVSIKRAAQTKCDQLAAGVVSLLSDKKFTQTALLERAGNLKTSDPFTLADQDRKSVV